MERLFVAEKYVNRRNELKKQIKSGIILMMGNNKASMNYTANTYKFRQDSNFLYFFGLDSPQLAGVIDIDNDTEILFGPEFTVDDLVWDGPIEPFNDRAKRVGVQKCMSIGKLSNVVSTAKQSDQTVHFLPPYRGDRTIHLAELLGISTAAVKNYVSVELIKAVIALRAYKDADEIREIEYALDNTTYNIYLQTMKMIAPGMTEHKIAAMAESMAIENGCMMSYPVICSVNGQYLHNESYDNVLHDGQLLLLDAGSESPMHYATDITRTYPVSRKFTSIQAELYNLELYLMQTAFSLMKPGVSYSFVHRKVSEQLAEGMISLGLMKGNVEEIANEGAQALFFPCGLGHLMGLDVHDMEDLDEQYTGYDDAHIRSTQFGTRYLRYGKKLTEGSVITVEPGIYFIPALIDLWHKEKKFTQFINYNKLDSFKGFGGIRVEDNVLITKDSNRILGKPIPKSIEELERVFQSV